MKILIAPDKFKGSLSAIEVCQAIHRGVKKYDPSIETIFHPLADGGEGALKVIADYLPLETIACSVNDPLFRQIEATYKIGDTTAYIEMAAASGLELLAQHERDCLHTTTYGTGELILDAINRGAKSIFLFVGGSATNDAGAGMAAALGYRFLDAKGTELSPIGKSLEAVSTIDESRLKFNPAAINVTVVCDVQNPLYGPEGAAFVYAPQKGASPAAVQQLDSGLRAFCQVLKEQLSVDVSKLAGAGAAGGLGGGAVAFLGASIQSGVETIMHLTHFKERLAAADLVITGEGRLDQQTLHGKVVKGVADACQQNGLPAAVLCGQTDLPEEVLAGLGFGCIGTLVDKGVTPAQAMTEAAGLLEQRTFEMMPCLLRLADL